MPSGNGSDDRGEGTTASAESTGGDQSTGDGSQTDDGSSGESTGASELEPPPCPDPQMVHLPIAAPQNIGYDTASCEAGTCEVSCPDVNADSNWNGGAGHHGIDLFRARASTAGRGR